MIDSQLMELVTSANLLSCTMVTQLNEAVQLKEASYMHRVATGTAMHSVGDAENEQLCFNVWSGFASESVFHCWF